MDLIGNTPLINLGSLINKRIGIRLYAKAEWINPGGGSIKDRPIKQMLLDGIISGDPTKDKIIIDLSSGNAGIAYSMIGSAMGYKVKIVITGNASAERKERIIAHGAELIEIDPLE